MDVMHSASYSTIEKQEHRILQCRTQENVRPLVGEPQLHFTQPSNHPTNHMNRVPPHMVDTTLPPLLLTKKEKEDSKTHTTSIEKMPQKAEGLLKVVQTVT